MAALMVVPQRRVGGRTSSYSMVVYLHPPTGHSLAP